MTFSGPGLSGDLWCPIESTKTTRRCHEVPGPKWIPHRWRRRLFTVLRARGWHRPLRPELPSTPLPDRVLKHRIFQDLARGSLQSGPQQLLRPRPPEPPQARPGLPADPGGDLGRGAGTRSHDGRWAFHGLLQWGLHILVTWTRITR